MLEMSPNQKALQKVNDQISRGELLNQTAQQFAQQRYRDQRSKNFYDMFVLNEGNKPQVYKDSKGNRTIGIGFNLEDAGNRKFLKESGIDINELFNGRKLTDRETKTLYNRSLTQAFKDAQSYDPNFAKRPEAVKMTLVDMAFNLGLTKLNKFEKMKAGLMNNDYNVAADEMIDSKWYKQVKSRGPRMVQVMRSAVR
jgi:lysozyme